MTVSTKGQVTIPIAIREKYDICPGDKILAENFGEIGFLVKKPLDFFSMKGSLSLGKIPANEEELITADVGRAIMERGHG